MPELLTADVSIEIDGKVYNGQYTVNMKLQSLTVMSEYGVETTDTSYPSPSGTPLENSKGMAQLVLQGIVEKYLVRTKKNY
ncbi:MAG: hypothetical protein AN482_12380 [Anabaena sp. LE011-02]|nr:MAG: hypothetical protein AN482_12380 [Anabaena sp. LE011-02]